MEKWPLIFMIATTRPVDFEVSDRGSLARALQADAGYTPSGLAKQAILSGLTGGQTSWETGLVDDPTASLVKDSIYPLIVLSAPQ
jgi:hypothetical protein